MLGAIEEEGTIYIEEKCIRRRLYNGSRGKLGVKKVEWLVSANPEERRNIYVKRTNNKHEELCPHSMGFWPYIYHGATGDLSEVEGPSLYWCIDVR